MLFSASVHVPSVILHKIPLNSAALVQSDGREQGFESVLMENGDGVDGTVEGKGEKAEMVVSNEERRVERTFFFKRTPFS